MKVLQIKNDDPKLLRLIATLVRYGSSVVRTEAELARAGVPEEVIARVSGPAYNIVAIGLVGLLSELMPAQDIVALSNPMVDELGGPNEVLPNLGRRVSEYLQSTRKDS